MFTGIIEHVAHVHSFEKIDGGARLVVEKPNNWNVDMGDSIAVNGACLTVVDYSQDAMSFDLMAETIGKTSFGKKIPDRVNLEKAATLESSLDGHMVSGHVDATGVVDRVKNNENYVLRISYDVQYANLVVPKGSITLDGVSLTVSSVDDDWCEVSLVPYTLEHTTLSNIEKGDHINIEFDMIGKYINRYMEKKYAGE